MTTQSIQNQSKSVWICNQCGSDKVQQKAWLYINKKLPTSGDYIDWINLDSQDDFWCDDCEDHTTVKEEYIYLPTGPSYKIEFQHPDDEDVFCQSIDDVYDWIDSFSSATGEVYAGMRDFNKREREYIQIKEISA